jgi:hypothetical protein
VNGDTGASESGGTTGRHAGGRESDGLGGDAEQGRVCAHTLLNERVVEHRDVGADPEVAHHSHKGVDARGRCKHEQSKRSGAPRVARQRHVARADPPGDVHLCEGRPSRIESNRTSPHETGSVSSGGHALAGESVHEATHAPVRDREGDLGLKEGYG